MTTQKMFAVAAALLVACSGSTGPQGPNGAAGPEGPQGQAGTMGTQGPQGPAGPSGPAGPGASSDAGADAPTGPAGVTQLDLPGARFYPESLAVAPDGTLFTGSVATGQIEKFAPGSAVGTTFLAPGGMVKGVAGLLVDAQTSSLIVCAVDVSFQTLGFVQGYDLATGMLKATFRFPEPADAGANPYFALPNDLTFDSSHRLYVTDSFGGKVYTLPDVTSDATMAVWVGDASLLPASQGAFGADGISFDGASRFYVNNNSTGQIIQIPQNGDGSAGPPVILTVVPPLVHPDGQRQLDATTLLEVDNAGTLSEVSVSGTSGTATTLANGLDAPTSVVSFGDYYWVTDGQITSSLLTGKAPNLPFVVQRITAYGR